MYIFKRHFNESDDVENAFLPIMLISTHPSDVHVLAMFYAFGVRVRTGRTGLQCTFDPENPMKKKKRPAVCSLHAK